jgi:hypothetical protein
MKVNQLDDELNSLLEIKQSWIRKRNDLRLEEPKLSDVDILHTLRTKIEEANEKIKMYDIEIAELEQKISTARAPFESEMTKEEVVREQVVIGSIENALEVLTQETKDLNYTSTKEDISKIHNLRVKIHNKLFQDLDKQLEFVVSKRDMMYASALFDTIYTSEILDTITINEILKIRTNDNNNFKWYDRSLIVSALTLSLINFKFDNKKANLLLDFVTDFEPKVWERALTGLIRAC